MHEIKRKIFKAFDTADSPVPYRFGFSGGAVEREYIENEKTNEDLYINCVESDEHGMSVRIGRRVKEKKNFPLTE